MSQSFEHSPLELEQASGGFVPRPDRRPFMPDPLPVRLLTVEDVRAEVPAGLERQLDDFYVDMLEFEREDDGSEIAFRAENAKLVFDVIEPPMTRPDLRPIVIGVKSLAEAERKLVDREIEYTRQRAIHPGEEELILLDPAGNWLSLVERRRVL
jgi:hypothetical protein